MWNQTVLLSPIVPRALSVRLTSVLCSERLALPSGPLHRARLREPANTDALLACCCAMQPLTFL